MRWSKSLKMHVKLHVHWTSTSVQSSLPSAIRVGAWTHGRPPTRAQAKIEPGKNVPDRMQTRGLREGYWSNHGLEVCTWSVHQACLFPCRLFQIGSTSFRAWFYLMRAWQV